jgi:hypothetical protein
MTAPLTIVVHPADPVAVTARRADRALEGHHVHVSVQKTGSGEAAVWLVENGDMLALGYWFLPGEQLVVSHDGWRIEDAPEVTA